MERGPELKARLFTELEASGYRVRLNYRLKLNRPVQGFKVVVLDIVVMDNSLNPVLAFYVGPDKKRRLFKYRLSRIPFLKLQCKQGLVPLLQETHEFIITKTNIL